MTDGEKWKKGSNTTSTQGDKSKHDDVLEPKMSLEKNPAAEDSSRWAGPTTRRRKDQVRFAKQPP